MTARTAVIWFPRRRFFRLALVTLFAGAVLVTYGRTARNAPDKFALAADVPRGALLYAQFSDLPSLIKRWEESKVREQYLASTNFQQLQSRHLALKLIERWEDFNNALGFPLDALALGEATENRAALAVYDFGRLEMIFVAPASEEKLAATRFFQSAAKFGETTLPDGTVYYSRDVDSDRGRRKQKLAFARAHDRIVLATSEQLLLRALANINGKSKNDRLVDEPSFTSLSGEFAPHSLTIWMDQSKLNEDWYFKQYWVMRNTRQLKDIRACMLDLELQEGKWSEHRDFLLAGRSDGASAVVPVDFARRIMATLPKEAPYSRLRALTDAGAAASLVRDTLMDRLPEKGKGANGQNWNWRSYDASDFDPGEGSEDTDGDGSYYSLDSSFDASIDDPADAGVDDEKGRARAASPAETERGVDESIRNSIERARPLYAATVEIPHFTDGPLFAEFRRGAILVLQSPANFRQQSFENAIASLVRSRLMIAGANAGLSWADASNGPDRANDHCNAQQCRELICPMLGWGLYYARRGPDLILANSPELLHSLLDENSVPAAGDAESPQAVHDLTVVRLDRREEAFDSIMQKLDAPRIKAYWNERKGNQDDTEGLVSQEFFSGDIRSLLDIAAPVREIRINRNSEGSRLREEVAVVFRGAAEDRTTLR